MELEDQEVVEQLEQTPEEIAEEAAFTAGFEDKAPGEEPATPAEETPPAGQESETPTVAEQIEALTPEQIQVLLAKATELDELKESTDTRLRQVFGRLGEVGGVLKQLQQTRSHKFAVPDDGLKRLAAEFPTLAEYLKADLDEVFGQMGPVSSVPDQEAMEALLKPRFESTMSEVEKLVERRLLKRAHPDWQKVVEKPEFEAWRNTLPADEAEALLSSFDADFLTDKITAHKEWLKQRAATAKAKQDRLTLAVAPRGDRPSAGRVEAADEEAAFLAGFHGR